MAFNQGVYDFVVAYLNDPQTIINQMVRLNVDVEQLADAIGMPTSQVINYFNNAGLQAPGMGYQEPGAPEEPVYEAPPEPVIQAPEPPSQSAGPTEAEVRAQIIRDAITSVYNDPNLTPYEKAQRINQAASANNVSRQEIASATGIGLDTINAYLDQAAPVTQAPPPTSVSTAVEGEVGQKPREGLAPSKDFAESTAIALLPGLGDGLFDSQGNRHTSTFVKTYKVVDGQTVETPFTPQDVSSNDFIFYIGSKTGGENRERAAQSYRLQNGKLVALGEPAYYKGAQDIGFFEGMLREGLPFIASVIPGLNVAIGAALGATSTVMAQALGNAVMNAALSVAAGANPADALKNAAVSFGVSQLIPNLTGNQFIDNAIKAGATAQLTGGKVGDAIANSLIQTGAQAATQGLSITGDRVIDSGLVSAATSALQSQVTGADTGFSALQGFVNGANAALAQKPVTEVPGTSTTIGGGATTGTVTGGATQDLGMDTAVSGAQDDVLGIVAQEQEADRVASASQVLQAPGQMQKVTAEDAAILGLTPLYEQYQGPNGTLYMRDINTGKITQVLPQGAATNVAGGGVFLDKPQVIGAIEALPANALYQGVLYTNDPSLIGKAITSDVLNNISISSERDFNIRPVGNLEITQNADGTYTQKDKVTGDTVTYGADNKIISQTKSLYTRLNDTANAVTGTGQSALGELGAAISAAGQQVGFDTQGLVENFQAMQAAGERMRPEVVNQQSKAFVDEIYQVASRPGVTAQEVVGAIVSAAKNNPAGAVAIIGSELIQELPQLLLPGKLAGFLGSMALNVAESAGAQALQKIDELKVTNPNATPQELARMARQDAGVAALVTAVVGLIPGANNVVARTLLEPMTEALEEGLIEYASSGDANAARGKAVLGAVIGGKTATAINTGEQLAAAAQNNLGVQVPGGVSATPGTSLTVTGTRLPTDTSGLSIDPRVDLTPGNLGSLQTTGVEVPTFVTAVVVSVDPVTKQASVIDNTGKISVVPAGNLVAGQSVQIPSSPTVTGGNQIVSTVTPAVGSSTVTSNVSQAGTGGVIDTGAANQGQVVSGGGATGVTQGGGTGSTAATGGVAGAGTGGGVVSGTGSSVGPTSLSGTGSVTGAASDVASGDTQVKAKTLADYSVAELAAASQNLIDQQKSLGNLVDQQSFVSFAISQGVPIESIGPLVKLLTFPGGTGISADVGAGTGVGTGTDTGTGTGTGTGTETGSSVVLDSGGGVTGVVLQDNGDGTSLVLTQDGGATNVSSVDATTGGTLSPGSSVTVNTSNNTATATGADTGATTGAQTTTGADTSVTTGTGTATGTATGTGTSTTTGTATDTATGVDTQTGTQTGVDTTTQTQTQTQPETGTQTEPETVTQVTPEPLPQINTEEPEPTQPEDLISPPPEPTVTEPTPEDQLLQQIIKELEKPTVPETPEPPPIEPPPFTPPESVVETPPVTVEQRLTVSPKTVRPTVMPGSRVEETAQILPIRPGLSEGGTGGIEGTPEEEQQPVWNVRSLKLRRLLGI